MHDVLSDEVTPSGSVYYIREPNGALIARVSGGGTEEIGGELDIARHALFLRRLLGLICDRLLLWMILAPVIMIIQRVDTSGFIVHSMKFRLWPTLVDQFGDVPGLVSIDLLVAFLFALPNIGLAAMLTLYIVISTSVSGGTPGMRMFYLRMRAVDGRRLSVHRIILWHVLSHFSVLLLGIGYIWAGFDAKGRTLHDILSGIRIVPDR